MKAPLLLIIGLVASLPIAANETLSAAEQEAIEALQPKVDKAHLVKMCQHILVYGDDERKADLLNQLDGKTCSEAVTDQMVQ